MDSSSDKILSIDGLFSKEANIKVDCCFKNLTDKTLKANWIGYGGKEINYFTLTKDQEFHQSTFATHYWAFRDNKTNNIIFIYCANKDLHQVIKINIDDKSSSTSVTNDSNDDKYLYELNEKLNLIHINNPGFIIYTQI